MSHMVYSHFHDDKTASARCSDDALVLKIKDSAGNDLDFGLFYSADMRFLQELRHVVNEAISRKLNGGTRK